MSAGQSVMRACCADTPFDIMCGPRCGQAGLEFKRQQRLRKEWFEQRKQQRVERRKQREERRRQRQEERKRRAEERQRKLDAQRLVLIKWKSLPHSACTWEYQADVPDLPRLLAGWKISQQRIEDAHEGRTGQRGEADSCGWAAASWFSCEWSTVSHMPEHAVTVALTTHSQA